MFDSLSAHEEKHAADNERRPEHPPNLYGLAADRVRAAACSADDPAQAAYKAFTAELDAMRATNSPGAGKGLLDVQADLMYVHMSRPLEDGLVLAQGAEIARQAGREQTLGLLGLTREDVASIDGRSLSTNDELYGLAYHLRSRDLYRQWNELQPVSLQRIQSLDANTTITKNVDVVPLKTIEERLTQVNAIIKDDCRK